MLTRHSTALSSNLVLSSFHASGTRQVVLFCLLMKQVALDVPHSFSARLRALRASQCQWKFLDQFLPPKGFLHQLCSAADSCLYWLSIV
jgi:hypothetical protein